MCGINGLYAYAPQAPAIDREELLRCRDAMRARGPDGAGEWISADGRIGLGHRRLAIIDLSESGAQPMSTPDGRFNVSFNGEIYNYAELREELARSGVRFRGHSDTEVLLYLYQRDGPEMVRHLRGMYAFALWYASAQTLFLARDRYGIKPLYYADDGKTFRFASQVQALLAGGALPRRVSPGGLTGFLMWGSVPEPLSFYQGIRELPAGHSLLIANGQVRGPTPYWRLGAALRESIETARDIPMGEEVDILKAALRDSVSVHMVADVPVGAFLSAGLDSSTLVGLARETGHDIEAFTVTAAEFHGQPSDEAPEAALVARHFGVPHRTTIITLEQARESIPAYLTAMDQPTVDGINTWVVTDATRRAGLKVALSGLGGDELLGGYPTFADIPAHQAGASWWMRHAGLAGAYAQGYAWLARLVEAMQPRESEKWRAARDLRAAYLWRRGMLMPWEIAKMLPREVFLAGLEELSAAGTWEDIPGDLPPFAQVALMESTRYMRNQLLRDSDWVGMAHSMELRTPMVDHLLTQEVAGLTALGRLGRGKNSLARTLANGLPDVILKRPKTGFTLPIWAWLHTMDDLSGWKRNDWLRTRHARNPYTRWGYAVLARMPEMSDLLL